MIATAGKLTTNQPAAMALPIPRVRGPIHARPPFLAALFLLLIPEVNNTKVGAPYLSESYILVDGELETCLRKLIGSDSMADLTH